MPYHFQPIAVEMLSPINKSASHFLTALAHKISQRSVDERETVFYVSAFLFCCSDSTTFCFTICLLVRTVWSDVVVILVEYTASRLLF